MTEPAKRILNLVQADAAAHMPAAGGESGTVAGPTPGDAPDVVFIIDPDGKILYVNRPLPGVGQDDVLGTSVYEYILPNHHSTVRAGVERVFSSGSPDGFEVLGMAHQSSNEWYDCRVVPTERAGRRHPQGSMM